MITKSTLFWWSRLLHAYISAFAFIALIFFSLTGLFLNHPHWFHHDQASGASEQKFKLSSQELTRAFKTTVPAETLTSIIREHITLSGTYKSGDILDDEAHIRLEGVKANSDIIVNLKDGSTEIATEQADVFSIVKDLHRGKNSGKQWQLFIDLLAYLVLALSLIGYILFFSLQFRLRTSLSLTVISIGLMVGLFWWFVP